MRIEFILLGIGFAVLAFGVRSPYVGTTLLVVAIILVLYA